MNNCIYVQTLINNIKCWAQFSEMELMSLQYEIDNLDTSSFIKNILNRIVNAQKISLQRLNWELEKPLIESNKPVQTKNQTLCCLQKPTRAQSIAAAEKEEQLKQLEANYQYIPGGN